MTEEPKPYDVVLGGNKTILVQIHLYQRPKDCFFNSVADIYCPGWAIGEVRLPCSAMYRGKLYLIRDAVGESWWIAANKVQFRGQTHRFDTQLGKEFDWGKIAKLNQLPIDYQRPPSFSVDSNF